MTDVDEEGCFRKLDWGGICVGKLMVSCVQSKRNRGDRVDYSRGNPELPTFKKKKKNSHFLHCQFMWKIPKKRSLTRTEG